MTDILEQIIANKRHEIAARKKKRSLAELKAYVEEHSSPFNLYDRLLNHQGPAIIAECKSKSPSRGIIAPHYDPVAKAMQYQHGGAAAISVLTDTVFFGGHHDHLRDVAQEVSLPVICKDFIIDEYQIYEARLHGASSFLLIAGVLDTAELQYFLEVGRDLGMEALVESHNSQDLELALGTDAQIIGINNRNLKTMVIDFEHILQFKERVEQLRPDSILVCESGVQRCEDVHNMSMLGIRAFLIGEYLMRFDDSTQALLDLREIPC